MYNYRGGTPGPREARLNPYHTHQILVDAQREYPEGSNAWGHEIDTRSRLENCYATAKGVPVVLLVVQGGPNTLDMMSAAAKQGSPLLVLSDSGGAATALAQYCAGGILLGMIPSMHYRRYSPAMFAGLVGTAVDYYVWYDETRVERARLGVPPRHPHAWPRLQRVLAHPPTATCDAAAAGWTWRRWRRWTQSSKPLSGSPRSRRCAPPCGGTPWRVQLSATRQTCDAF